MRRKSPVWHLQAPALPVAGDRPVREGAGSPRQGSPHPGDPRRASRHPANPNRASPAHERRAAGQPPSGNLLNPDPPAADLPPESPPTQGREAAGHPRENPLQTGRAAADLQQVSLPTISPQAAGPEAEGRDCAERSVSYANGRERTGSPSRAGEPASSTLLGFPPGVAALAKGGWRPEPFLRYVPHNQLGVHSSLEDRQHNSPVCRAKPTAVTV